jgi:hypothetical protein
MKSRLLRFNAQSMLDIGCGEGLAMLLSHYVLGIDTFFGFDHATESYILQTYNDRRNRCHQGISEVPCTRLEEIWNTVTTSNDRRPRIEDTTRYRPLLNPHYDMTVQRFGAKADLKGHNFDIIICSQVFHFMDEEDIQDTLRLIQNHRHPASMIYISAKTGFKGKAGTDSRWMMRTLRSFASEQGLNYYWGRRATDGRCHTFTNI